MNWTSEPPTESGWYAWRINDQDELVVVQVITSGGVHSVWYDHVPDESGYGTRLEETPLTAWYGERSAVPVLTTEHPEPETNG